MCNDPYRSTAAHEARLRRAVRKAGCYLTRSRWRARSIDNFGGFMLCDASVGACVAGPRFNLTPGDVEDWLAE